MRSNNGCSLQLFHCILLQDNRLKYTDEELDEIYHSVKKRESLPLVILGSLAGVILGLVVFYLFALIGWAFVVAMLIPSALAGYGARILGKPIRSSYRCVAGLFGAGVYCLGAWFLFGANPLFMLLAPVGFFAAYYFSKARLSKEEVHAVWKKGISG